MKIKRKLFLTLITIFVVFFTLITKNSPPAEAAGEQTSLFFTETGSTAPITKLSLNPGTPKTISLYLNTHSNNINGFDISIRFPNSLTLDNQTEGAGSTLFNDALVDINDIDRENNIVRFAKVSTNTNQTIRNNALHLANFTFTGQTASGSGNIQFADTIIISPSNILSGLTVAKPSLPFTIAALPTTTGGAGSAFLSLSLKLSGVGIDGNPEPTHRYRDITVCLYAPTADPTGDASCNRAVVKQIGQVVYNSSTGTFTKADFPIISSITSGQYQVYVKTNKYLRRRVPGMQTVNTGSTPNPITQVTLLAGDINSDNNVNIQDYNIYAACFGEKQASQGCQDTLAANHLILTDIDLNDDNIIDNRRDLSDYKLILESINAQKGD